MHLAHLCSSFLIPFHGPQVLVYCHSFHTVYQEDGILVCGTDRSQKESYQENMGDEEGFQIHIQSRQLVTCGLGIFLREQQESVFLACIVQFPGVATSIRLHYMHRLSCDLAKDNHSWSPLDYPKRLRPSLSLLNEPS